MGTLFSSPQNVQTGSGVATFYGGVAVGEGIAASLSNWTAPFNLPPISCTLNFSYKSAVGSVLENYCERVIVHYPYFYKP